MSNNPSITPELVFDIFNIKRDGSNIVDDDGDFDIGAPDAIPFADKAKEVADEIAAVAPGILLESAAHSESAKAEPAAPKAEEKVEEKPAPKAEIQKEIEAPKVNKEDVETAVKKSVADRMLAGIFDEEEASVEPTAETPKDEMPETAGKAESGEAEQQGNEVETTVSGEHEQNEPSPISTVPPTRTELKKGGYRWKLVSPAPKFERLYAEKRELLSYDLLTNGEIPFSQYYRELEDATVDTNVPSYDTEEVGRRITEVQQWRDRVKFIQLHCNAQYFVWKHILEPLKGVLGRIEYEKNKAKQEGLDYEHLNDFITYFGHLEGLVTSIGGVIKNLDGAYNSLSRQVSIAQPLQEVERYTNNVSRPPSPKLSAFDTLTHANNGGQTAARPKEAPKKGAEPQGPGGTVPWGEL